MSESAFNLTPNEPLQRSVLMDGHGGETLELFKKKSLFTSRDPMRYSFIQTVRAMEWPDRGVDKADLEDLVSRIQETLLVRMADPDFPDNHPKEDFPEEYRVTLEFWLKEFQQFLAQARSTVFILY